MARVNAPVSPNGTTSPEWRSRIRSRHPGTSVVTMGHAAAIASSSALGRPSVLDGKTKTSADFNKDGRVTLAEAQQAALQRFDRIDLNRDGKLTPEERQQARQQLRAQRPKG